MAFGIIQRYVMWEVVRAFMMALLTMTIIFVLFMVMAEAANLGLSPRELASVLEALRGAGALEAEVIVQ